MPPRIPFPSASLCCRATLSTPATSLTACLARLTLQQTRNASILGSLANNPGAVHKKKRVGRGPSSGHGKTSGRGHKGQGQHGKVKPWFQGGQTPLIVKHGRKGFDNFRAPEISEVNLDQIQNWIDQGRLDPTKQITPKELIESKLIGSVKDGVKILSRGGENLKQPINVMVSRVSSGAIAAIEAAGGTVLTRYYTKLAIQRLLTGESVNTDKPLPVGPEHVEGILAEARKGPFRYRLPDPTSRADIEYYRDPAHRGYLSHQIAPGQSPSLYFKVPGPTGIAAERTVTALVQPSSAAITSSSTLSQLDTATDNQPNLASSRLFASTPRPQQIFALLLLSFCRIPPCLPFVTSCTRAPANRSPAPGHHSMSLFGDEPTDNGPALGSSPRRGGARSSGLFEDEPASGRNSSSLFDDGSGASSPWDMPTPRKQQSRAELIRNLLPASDVPESYIETFDAVVREDGQDGQVTASGIAKLFAVARLEADAQARIMSLVAPGGSDVLLSRNEFNVVLALIGLAQEGDIISLDGVDERRKDIPRPKLPGLTAEPIMPPVAELAAKPPQVPSKHESDPDPESDNPEPLPQFQPQPQLHPPSQPEPEHSQAPASILSRSTMVDPDDDPWNTPDMHKGHSHQNGNESHNPAINGHNNGFNPDAPPAFDPRPTNHYSAPPEPIRPPNRPRQISSTSLSGQGGWGAGFYGSSPAGGGFTDIHQPQPQPPIPNIFGAQPQPPIPNIFGADGAGQIGAIVPPPVAPSRSLGGRVGNNTEEVVVVTLMPGKEGIFMFQHHNYEVTSQRRGSKVVRRYSDFVWLLDCLHKRYPFRMLPLLPPKRVAVNGNHLSNDGAFIEKRRRGLGRFLNAIVRHPVLSLEQLVIMFLTVPTELAVWRKQATISVQDEFTDRALPPGLEDSLPPTLEDLFIRTRNGVRRSAELYINSCNIMDRLVKRTEGVAADHARVALSLISLTEVSADTYATDTSEIPLLNDGLTAMSKHLRTCQSLLEDESRGWDEGVLEDLKRQRDALVSLRELFDRRERLDKDNIPYLERRIQANETKLANLRSKPEGLVKPGEIEKVAEAIIKDKESIVQQHNRSIFVKEALRDELIAFQSTQYHVSRWNQDWAGERVKYAEMLADNWRRLLDALEGMPLGD
ncbi:hypothetical protein M431DRAFT_126138 [Trichoderma harzianum CBS 226.95]|uniref:Sorting nexin MVP1 n=1 Tax=Trichoderma harzianum CBS 226.95 TaxID=983964 RepID=A0A2T3ZX82_TRIHA|nr:hypothetical protein M431DRAFT_126138 [Trichoderma harzianum CBS 226.95]PTB49388.1 hypothetical protein M431DRAFT_126138 [Trichoderma harzianum CBS 226.95]